MKERTLAMGIVTTALLLTLGVVTLITALTLRYVNNRKLVQVSYPCIVVKGDRWIHRADLKMCSYMVFESDLDDSGAKKDAGGR